VDVLNRVRALAHEQALGVVAAIHDLGLAARFCDRLVMMKGGRIVADGQPEDVLTPERIAEVFEIDGQIYRDPYNGTLALSFKA
jgi:iron complex transport system ATP-binding protein